MLRLSSHAGAGQRLPPIPGERLSPPPRSRPPGATEVPRVLTSPWGCRRSKRHPRARALAGRARLCSSTRALGEAQTGPLQQDAVSSDARGRPQEQGAPGAPPARTRHLAPRSKLLLEPSLGKALPGWVLSRDGDRQPLTSRDTLLVSFCFFPFFPPLKINPRLSSSKSAELMLHGKL